MYNIVIAQTADKLYSLDSDINKLVIGRANKTKKDLANWLLAERVKEFSDFELKNLENLKLLFSAIVGTSQLNPEVIDLDEWLEFER